MRYLCIDSSSGSSVCIADCDADNMQVLAQLSCEDSRRHGENLAPMIKQLIEEAGYQNLTQAGIDAVVCGTGPAPYTGLRCGLVSAKVVADVLGKQILGVCSLDALAAQAFELAEKSGIEVKEVFVATDARRKEVYYSVYTKSDQGLLEAVIPASVDRPENISGLTAGRLCVGQGYLKYAQVFDSPAPIEGDLQIPVYVQAKYMAKIAFNATRYGVDLSDTKPLYLRRPDVQEK